MTRRGAALRVGVLAYVAVLALAAVPPKLRPGFLDLPGRSAGRALEALSISPGLAIFSGSVRAVHRRATCVAVHAEDPGGAVRTLYASGCPPTGFRWRIDPWDEMVEGLVRRTRIEVFARSASREPGLSYELLKLQAVGDFFCHSPLAALGPRAAVTLEFRNLLVLYSSGIHSEDRPIACRWRCGVQPLPAPVCERSGERA